MFSRSIMSLRAVTPRRASQFPTQARGIATYIPTGTFSLFSEQREREIRQKSDSLPKVGSVFQNPDGSMRIPTDEESRTAAELQHYAQMKRYTLIDTFRSSKEQMQLLMANSRGSRNFSDNRKISDKVPYEDHQTGETKWKVVREGHTEGWEGPFFYWYLPTLSIVGMVYFSKAHTGIQDWALEESNRRAQEQYDASSEELPAEANTPEAIKKRDAILVERILSGEYDRLQDLTTPSKKGVVPVLD